MTNLDYWMSRLSAVIAARISCVGEAAEEPSALPAINEGTRTLKRLRE